MSRVLSRQPVRETRIRRAGLSLLEISTPENLMSRLLIVSMLYVFNSVYLPTRKLMKWTV